MNWVGGWNTVVAYATDDAVSYLGESWVAVSASTAGLPPGGVEWQLLAASGAQGDVGPQGLKGDTGLTGAIGATGSQGPQGLTGNTGPQGLTGNAGPQGLTGNAGPQGLTGNTGPQGLTGSTGPQGTKGDAGPQGPGALVIDGNNNPIGRLVYIYPGSGVGSGYLVLRPDGLVWGINPATGAWQGSNFNPSAPTSPVVWFTGPGCTGQAFLVTNGSVSNWVNYVFPCNQFGISFTWPVSTPYCAVTSMLLGGMTAQSDTMGNYCTSPNVVNWANVQQILFNIAVPANVSPPVHLAYQ